jgi:hypothetical protein
MLQFCFQSMQIFEKIVNFFKDAQNFNNSINFWSFELWFFAGILVFIEVSDYVLQIRGFVKGGYPSKKIQNFVLTVARHIHRKSQQIFRRI